MKTGKIVFLLVILFISCNDSSDIPPGIIKPAQMQDLLWDIIRGDILAQELIKKDSTKTLKNESFALSEKIFLLHKTNRAKFETSIAFYEKHPGLIKVIFDSLNSIKARRIPTAIERKMERSKDYHLTPTGNLKAR